MQFRVDICAVIAFHVLFKIFLSPVDVLEKKQLGLFFTVQSIITVMEIRLKRFL